MTEPGLTDPAPTWADLDETQRRDAVRAALERELSAQTPLTEAALILQLEGYFGSPAAAQAWLAAPHPALKERAPAEALARGDLRTVHRLLLMAMNGTPP